MQNGNNESFEETLKDILRPDDPHMAEHNTHIKQNGNNQTANHKQKSEEKKKPGSPQHTSMTIPPWVETIVRTVATLLGALLLILFALHIAKR